MTDFPERLKKLRKEKNIYQKELADKLNVGRTTIGGYEQGSRFPDKETLNELADFFDVSVDYLLGRTDRKKTDIDIPEEVMKFLNDEEQEFIIDLIQKDQIQSFLREARGASDEDLATAIRVFKAVKEGKEKGDQL